MNTPLESLEKTHKIIWHGKFLDGTLAVLTDSSTSIASNVAKVICVIQGMDIEYTCEALVENTQAGLEKLISQLEYSYKAACAEELQDLTQNYGLKPN
jgi:hypothetical protein